MSITALLHASQCPTLTKYVDQPDAGVGCRQLGIQRIKVNDSALSELGLKLSLTIRDLLFNYTKNRVSSSDSFWVPPTYSAFLFASTNFI